MSHPSDPPPESDRSSNILWRYLQSLSPETIDRLSKPTSREVFQVMERNIVSLLGNLPGDRFGVSISTNREDLGQLLASAMMNGYFLRNVEQRMGLERSLSQVQTRPSDDRES